MALAAGIHHAATALGQLSTVAPKAYKILKGKWKGPEDLEYAKAGLDRAYDLLEEICASGM